MVLYFNNLFVTCFLHTNSIYASANARSTDGVVNTCTWDNFSYPNYSLIRTASRVKEFGCTVVKICVCLCDNRRVDFQLT